MNVARVEQLGDGWQLMQVVLVAIVVSVLAFLLQAAHVGFALGDAGYHWYGVQRVLQGEVPLRDFMAYDPGRYYWSASIMAVAGDAGIIALRVSIILLEVVALTACLSVLLREWPARSWVSPLLVCVLCVIWMYPRHKIFDTSQSLLLLAALALLMARPSVKRFFIAGVVLGLAAVVGRNHGFYGVLSGCMAVLWLALGQSTRSSLWPGLAYCGAGVALGYSPILLMLLAVDGFPLAFWESISFLFEIGATNIPVPVPWPWVVDLDLPPAKILRSVLLGSHFVALLGFPAIGLLWMLKNRLWEEKVSPVFVAAIFISIPYAHHAFSRADVSHMAQAIQPLLFGVCAVVAWRAPRFLNGLAAAWVVVSLFILMPYQPTLKCYNSGQCVAMDIAGDNVLVYRQPARAINLIKKMAEKYPGDNGSFLVVPFWPGAYAMMEIKAPIWDVYPLFGRRPEIERAEIERIRQAAPGFAIIIDRPVSGFEQYKYSNTHALTLEYIKENSSLQEKSPRANYHIYVDKGDSN